MPGAGRRAGALERPHPRGCHWDIRAAGEASPAHLGSSLHQPPTAGPVSPPRPKWSSWQLICLHVPRATVSAHLMRGGSVCAQRRSRPCPAHLGRRPRHAATGSRARSCRRLPGSSPSPASACLCPWPARSASPYRSPGRTRSDSAGERGRVSGRPLGPGGETASGKWGDGQQWSRDSPGVRDPSLPAQPVTSCPAARLPA